MKESVEWHLTKGFSVGLVFSILGMIAGFSIAWANTLNDIARNKERGLEVSEDIASIQSDLKIIREGLIAEGIIKVK